jgi:di/tricarboxylate transporter
MGGLSGNAWFAIAVAISIFAAMFFSKLRADVVFLAGMSALFVSGVLDIKGAFGGLISPSVLVIAAIYAVIAGLNHMLVYATGNYRFSDFMKIGLPMNFIILAANIFIVSIIFPL